MSTIAGRKAACRFQPTVPVCGNCVHERRGHNEKTKRVERTCAKHGIYVRLTSSCDAHTYRNQGDHHAPAQP